MTLNFFPSQKINTNITIPGDKSISHRSIIIASLSDGKVLIKNFLDADDCNRTVEAFKKLGVDIDKDNNDIIVSGVGIKGLKPPSEDLYLGNSGTSMRIMLGVLAGQSFTVTLTGDDSLSSRPMNRIISPLSKMGAVLKGRNGNNYAPITVKGSKLTSIDYKSPVSSAQVKSSILLAGLYANGTTSVTEPYKSRDHTERLLSYLGADIKVDKTKVSINPVERLESKVISIPGDISSAMYFITAGLIVPDSKILIQNVGLNPTRTGALNIFKKMGAKIKIIDNSLDTSFEPFGDIEVETSNLKAVIINERDLPSAIDEIPLIIVAACFADGITKIYKASELRVKETDRIESMVSNLIKMGADIRVEKDDIFINGGSLLKGDKLKSFNDHRTAMSLTIAGMACESGMTTIDHVDCVSTSFPGFFDVLQQLNCKYEIN